MGTKIPVWRHKWYRYTKPSFFFRTWRHSTSSSSDVTVFVKLKCEKNRQNRLTCTSNLANKDSTADCCKKFYCVWKQYRTFNLRALNSVSLTGNIAKRHADKKLTQNPKNYFLGTSSGVICGQKINMTFFFKKIEDKL